MVLFILMFAIIKAGVVRDELTSTEASHVNVSQSFHNHAEDGYGQLGVCTPDILSRQHVNKNCEEYGGVWASTHCEKFYQQGFKKKYLLFGPQYGVLYPCV